MNVMNKLNSNFNKNNVAIKYKFYLPLLLLLLCCVITLRAQTTKYSVEDFEYQGGEFEINAGIGLMSTFVSRNSSTKVPPLSMILNYRVKKHFSLGAYLGYSSTLYDPVESPKDVSGKTPYLRNDFYLAGLRVQGHYNSGRADFYGGAMLAYNFSKIDTNITDPLLRPEGIEIEERSLVTYSGFIGLKYFVTPKFGLYGEIGYGASLINLGASYRF
jgi:hypothetical protein